MPRLFFIQRGGKSFSLFSPSYRGREKKDFPAVACLKHSIIHVTLGNRLIFSTENLVAQMSISNGSIVAGGDVVLLGISREEHVEGK